MTTRATWLPTVDEQPEFPELELGGRSTSASSRRLLVAVVAVVLALMVVCGSLFVTLGAAVDVVTVAGVIVPSRLVDVFAVEPGEVVAVPVTHGMRVARGDTFLVLRSDQLSEQRQQLAIMVDEQRALLRLAAVDTTADRERRRASVDAAQSYDGRR